MTAIPNPNGANSTTSDPREQICWDFYLETLLGNKGNAYESAIKAGYSPSSAKNITMRDWFKARLRKLDRKEMLSKAEKNLHKVLDTVYVNEEGAIQADVMRIVVDVSKTIVTTLGKNDGYSTRNEVTGAEGEPLGVVILPERNDTKDDK